MGFEVEFPFRGSLTIEIINKCVSNSTRWAHFLPNLFHYDYI
jgi:hypothetical protein